MAKPLRILHVFRRMDRGGAETYIMHVYRRLDPAQFQMDFLVFSAQPGDFDAEIVALGGRVIPCPVPSRPLMFKRNFARVLKEYGPYDFVHSHVHLFSGFVLRLARQAGVPGRIAHNHTNTLQLQASARPTRRLYNKTMLCWIAAHATLGLSGSRLGAPSLFSPDWRADPRWHVLYYGIDLEPFTSSLDQLTVRRELDLPDDAFVVGHVGRFVPVKNHQFIVQIAAELVKRAPQTRVVLLGEGTLQPAIRAAVAAAGLERYVIFAGLQSDVPRFIKGAFDVLILPSFYEGVPLTGLEAMAAGLPLVLSDRVTTELDAVPALIRRLPVTESAAHWAEAILATRDINRRVAQPEALHIMVNSHFNIENAASALSRYYQAEALRR